MPYTLHVVSHTHWDREWYYPYQLFRLRLVDLFDNLLETLDTDPDFIHFSMDAQTIVLEDYLAIRPQNRDRLAKYIQEGRISIGPWYQLNDEFLVSGEATVRSLLIGHQIAAEFGKVQQVGYLPDQFGNISQMPQILRGFNIDNAIMGRGRQLANDRKMEFVWESPDGSTVLSSLMAFWYNNAQTFPSSPDRAAEFATDIRNRMAPAAVCKHLLLMNGVDHLDVQKDIGKIIRSLEIKLKPDVILHSSLNNYVQALREETQNDEIELEHCSGELREDRGGSCLAGTLSARMYLKQANDLSQIGLEHYAERIASFARIATGAKYPEDTLRYAWKLLMQNHPHDSICGCSSDETHQDMLPRFRQTDQITTEITDRALDSLSGRDRTKGADPKARKLMVINTLNWERTDPVTAIIDFPLGEPARDNPKLDRSKKINGFLLLDQRGMEVPFAIKDASISLITVTNPRELPLTQWIQRYIVEFVAQDVPACGYRFYTIQPAHQMPRYPDQTEEQVVSPYSVVFEDCGDVGDEYFYKPPMNDQIFQLRLGGAFTSEEVNPVRKTLIYSQDWHLPACAENEGKNRSEKQLACRITTRLTKWAGLPRMEFETVFDNRVQDHRLRVCFENAYGIQFRPFSYSEGQFDVLERPIQNIYAEEHGSSFHPQQSWTALVGDENWVEDEDNSESTEQTLTLMNRGLPEFEVYSNAQGVKALTLTLLRSVGQLSGGGDGPGLPTPEAQCIGEHRFQYAWMQSPGCWKGGMVWKQAHQFHVPLQAVQCPGSDEIAPNRSFLRVDPAMLIVSAIKKTEGRDTILVRFFNTTEDVILNARISMPGAKKRRMVNLLEEPQEEWINGDTWNMDAPPKKILSYEFAL
jgi:alpha-mannosidase